MPDLGCRAYGRLPFADDSAGAGASAGTPGPGWPFVGPGCAEASLRVVPLAGVLAVEARAVSRWPIRSSRSWLTAAVSRRDCLSARRAALPRREVRRAPASSRL